MSPHSLILKMLNILSVFLDVITFGIVSDESSEKPFTLMMTAYILNKYKCWANLESEFWVLDRLVENVDY